MTCRVDNQTAVTCSLVLLISRVPLGARIAIGQRVLCRDAGLVGCLVMHAFGGICSKVGERYVRLY